MHPEPMTETVRILVVEDQFFFRVALHSIVNARVDMEIVGGPITHGRRFSFIRSFVLM